MLKVYKRVKKLGCVLVLLLSQAALISCGVEYGSSHKYADVKALKALQIPKGLSTLKPSDKYSIPKYGGIFFKEAENIVPPDYSK